MLSTRNKPDYYKCISFTKHKMKEETEMHVMMQLSQTNSSRPYWNPLKIYIALQYYNKITMPKMALNIIIIQYIGGNNVYLHFIIFLYKHIHIIGQEIYNGI